MAVLTPLSLEDAKRIADAHGVVCTGLKPIAAGSVNSNFVLEGAPAFLRIYEEQHVDGVAYEWALLDQLRASGIPTPERLGAVAPGEVRVGDKCTAVFAWSAGEMSCQHGVSTTRAHALGRIVAQAHQAVAGFGWRRAGRFTRADIGLRMQSIPRDAELAPVLERLERTRAEVDAHWPTGLPSGPVHGDLFRDNLLWEGDEVSAVIDWESASDHFFAYDLAVTMLAWCMGDVLDWELARALFDGYQAQRALTSQEWSSLHVLARSAALRFSVTRITDFHLREGGDGVQKDYRRFIARLDALESLQPEEFRQLLGAPAGDAG